MMARGIRLVSAALAVAVAGSLAATAVSQPQTPAAVYTPEGKLAFPKDYRTWVYLSSGFDMAYTAGGAGDRHRFDNVFGDPAAYAAFEKTGTWPDGTMLVLENRRADSGSINKSGRFQKEGMGLEVHVKDTARFKSGWAFFPFDGEKPAQALPQTSGCNACHEAHAAVDTTFVQFYPTLIPTAQARKTFSAAYLAEEAKLAGEKR